MQFKPYPEYKDSGVEWLGEVPAHWDIVPSKFYFIERGEKANADDQQLTASQVHGIVYQKDYIAHNGRVMAVIKNAEILKKVMPLDFVISMRSFQGGLELSNLKGSISSAYVMLKPDLRYVFVGYYKYLFKSKNYIIALQSTSNLIRDGQALRFNNFSQIKLPLPSVEIQKAITSFLDHETSKIDLLISKQEKLIELLEEQRKSIISHAVTKGLDPNAPMKDSGVEWLGDVPAHWNIMPIKSAIASWRNGKWGNDLNQDQSDNLVCVRVADFDRTKGIVKTEKLTLRNYTGENIEGCLLNSSHILIERSGGGENQPVGTTIKYSLNEKAVCSNFISLLEVKISLFHLNFIQYSFEHSYNLRANKLSIKQTSGIQNLDLNQYLSNNFAFPLKKEQNQIASYLNQETSKIDTTIDKQKMLIEKLKEYRSSIISHAVTGKIDIRDMAA